MTTTKCARTLKGVRPKGPTPAHKPLHYCSHPGGAPEALGEQRDPCGLVAVDEAVLQLLPLRGAVASIAREVRGMQFDEPKQVLLLRAQPLLAGRRLELCDH